MVTHGGPCLKDWSHALQQEPLIHNAFGSLGRPGLRGYFCQLCFKTQLYLKSKKVLLPIRASYRRPYITLHAPRPTTWMWFAVHAELGADHSQSSKIEEFDEAGDSWRA